MKTNDYELRISQPVPSMNMTRRTFTGTFIEACNEARRIFTEEGFSVYVGNGNPSGYYFKINRNGEENRNINAACR